MTFSKSSLDSFNLGLSGSKLGGERGAHNFGSVVSQIIFSSVDGSNSKLWEKRCEKNFEVYVVPVEK